MIIAMFWRAGLRWAPWLAALVVIALLASVVFTRMRGEGSEHALFEQLVARCRDRELAERLVEAERTRAPNASRAVLIRRALDRLSRHRR